MKEISVSGIVSKILDQYIITTNDGTEYKLSAILPWEAVAADFAPHVGKRMIATGTTDGYTIWRAALSES